MKLFSICLKNVKERGDDGERGCFLSFYLIAKSSRASKKLERENQETRVAGQRMEKERHDVCQYSS